MSIYQARRPIRVEPSAGIPLAEPLPLDELAEEFVDGYRYTGSPRTLEHYEAWSRHLFPWLAAQKVVRLDQFEARHVIRYLGELAQRIAPVSVRKAYNQIHRFFAWCQENQYCQRNPCQVVKAPAVPEGTRHAFEDHEVKRMSLCTNSKDGPTGTRDRAILALLLDTGIRARELCNMRLSDVDWPRGRILVHLGKGNKDRWLPIGHETQRRLKLWVRLRWPIASDRLWLTLRREPLEYSALASMCLKLGLYADVNDCTPHRFRHTYATSHYRAHHDIIALQTLLGHASIEMTMRYLRSLGVSYGAEAGYRTPGEWLLAP